MIFWKRKKKVKESDIEPLGTSLKNLKKGSYFDYDGKTWKVTERNRYEWGKDLISKEWKIENGSEIRLLEHEYQNEDIWTLSERIALSAVADDLEECLNRNGEPPLDIEFEGVIYGRDEGSGGYFFEESGDRPREMVVWLFVDPSEKKILTIEQWGEASFTASKGVYVEENQFANIVIPT